MYGPLRFSRSDAVALSIQRGRDFGLPSYNQIRAALNMRPVNTWAEINTKLENTQVLLTASMAWTISKHLDNYPEPLHLQTPLKCLIKSLFNAFQLLRELAELYENDTSRLELFVGGLLETQEAPGPVFSSIVLDQFERIRNADRFWFENRQNGWESMPVWSDNHT